jgi:hypothetical protein
MKAATLGIERAKNLFRVNGCDHEWQRVNEQNALGEQLEVLIAR